MTLTRQENDKIRSLLTECFFAVAEHDTASFSGRLAETLMYLERITEK